MKLDTLMVEAIAATCREREIEGAIREYLEIAEFLDQGIRQQVEFDAESLTEATGISLLAGEWEQCMSVQRQAIRWTFLDPDDASEFPRCARAPSARRRPA